MWRVNLSTTVSPSFPKMLVEMDTAAIIAACIVIGILAASLTLWILHLQLISRRYIPEENVRAWPIGWINFGIFLCAMVLSVILIQISAGQFIQFFSSNQLTLATEESIQSGETATNIADQPPLTPWMAVLAVLLLQLPLLAAFYGLRRFYPGNFAGRLNSQKIQAWQAIRQVIPQFIRYLPIIWIVAYLWSVFLKILQEQGIIGEFPPQQLVTLFTQGGDPVAMTLLVIFAVVLAPIVEEIIFRGAIYRFLKSQTNILPAQIISGTFFALMHGNLMSLLPLVVVGIVLARVYEQSGNILTAICFHSCFNGFSLFMLLMLSQSSVPFD